MLGWAAIIVALLVGFATQRVDLVFTIMIVGWTLGIMFKGHVARFMPKLNTPGATLAATSQEVAAIPTSRVKPEPKATALHKDIMPHDAWWKIATQDALHIRLIGPSGWGKSVIAQALASEFDGKLIIIDPVWKRGNWGGLPAVTVDAGGEFGPIEAALNAIIREMKDRGAHLQTVDNPTFERLTILFDEVPDTVTELPEQAGLLVRRLGQRGRHGNMHLIGMGQSERVKAWGLEGYGDAAENFATIYLGSKAIKRLPEHLRDVQAYPAVLEWRGKEIPIDTTQVLRLSQRPISLNRILNLSNEGVNDVTSYSNEQFSAMGRKNTTQNYDENPLVTSAETAQIAAKLGSGMAVSNVAKSLPGYTPARYKEFTAKVEAVRRMAEE